MIQTVKEQRGIETQKLQGYLLNGSMYVPIAEGNSHYQQIQEWIAQGNTPEPAYTTADRLQYFKDKLKRELKQIVDSRYEKSVIPSTQLGVDIDAGQKALTNVQGLIDILPDDTTTIDFRIADNSFVAVTRPDLVAVKTEILQAGQVLYQTKWTIEAQIDALTDDVVASNKEIDFDNTTLVDITPVI